AASLAVVVLTAGFAGSFAFTGALAVVFALAVVLLAVTFTGVLVVLVTFLAVPWLVFLGAEDFIGASLAAGFFVAVDF
ncbi:MAG: hypothetical protein O2874_09215, partial [Verrucomicrobia bacterium]|nr:hypothetical protein [Verrucomicrobiota bacterium]MDA0906481.1 hypothetical protein [Verrucomicrobiota bacterium]